MANELRVPFPAVNTIYAVIRNRAGQVWYPTGETFEDWGTGSRNAEDYAIVLTEKTGGYYVGDFPTEIPSGDYIREFHNQLGSVPADTDFPIAAVDIAWTGIAEEVAAVAEVGATDICNLALIRCGVPEADLMTSFYDGSKHSNLCNKVYPEARRRASALWEWNEGTKYADLGAALSGDSLPEMADWDYAFNLPSDCLGFIAQVDQDAHNEKYEYELKDGKLLTNELTNSDGDSAYIHYINEEKTVTVFKVWFRYVVALCVAIDLSVSLAGKDRLNLKESLQAELYEFVLPICKSLNQSEKYHDDEGSYSWLDARIS